MTRKRYSYDADFWHYTPKPAREVTGGLRARAQKGSFTKTWWGREWIDALERTGIGARLSRGRAYARKGQVADLRFDGGEVHATVQGSQRTPYRITIRLAPWRAGDVDRVCTALRDVPLLSARLVAHDMPMEIIALCVDLGVPLFPGRGNDLKTSCSCPDWSNPCKHIAAVHYLLAEALDEDPFLLFEMRGLARDTLFAQLRAEVDAAAEPIAADDPPCPLPHTPVAFWSDVDAEQLPPQPPIPSPPAVTAALPLRLGALPFWRSLIPFQTAMSEYYHTASEITLLSLADDEAGEED